MNGGGEPLSTPAQLVRSFDSERPRASNARVRSCVRSLASSRAPNARRQMARHRATSRILRYICYTHPSPWNRPLVIPRELACPRARFGTLMLARDSFFLSPLLPFPCRLLYPLPASLLQVVPKDDAYLYSVEFAGGEIAGASYVRRFSSRAPRGAN